MLCSREQQLPLQLPPIRPGFSPMGLYQDLKASSSSQMGVRDAVDSIQYIDDILLLAESKEKAGDQTSGLVYLLECLGFTIDINKSAPEPSQSLEFLGFTVNSATMKLSLPTEQENPGGVLEIAGGRASVSSRPHKIDWQDECRHQIIPPAPLFAETSRSAAAHDYETSLTLFLDSRKELVWWDTRMSSGNGKSIQTNHRTGNGCRVRRVEPRLGSVLPGKQLGGPWSAQERTWHINCKELLVATLV